jgi:hypothetical protein
VDYSICVKEAVASSAFFAAIRPRITGLKPTMYTIKGDVIELYSSDMDTINLELNKIQEISYANIKGAVEQICNDSQQAILITDCEYWTKPEGERTNLPYIKEPFIKWLNKGYSIHIAIEPYKEPYKGKLYEKKRFYFFFTDDKLSDNVFAEVSKTDNFTNHSVSFCKLTNADLRIQRNIDAINANLTVEGDTTHFFDYFEIDNPWEDIQKYVIEATDDEGNPISGGDALIKGIKLSGFNNYTIEDIDIVASNITAKYLDTIFSTGHSTINISDGFSLDKNSLKDNELNVKINEKIFKNLNDEFGGNLIRLDFVVKSAKNKPVSKPEFSWQSLNKPAEENISVYESIVQTLQNPDVNPAKQNNVIIHTIFLKTQKY